MSYAWIAAVIVPVFVFILLLLCCSCFVVSQSEAVVIERFGRFHKILPVRPPSSLTISSPHHPCTARQSCYLRHISLSSAHIFNSQSGLSFVVPMVDSPRKITWSRTTVTPEAIYDTTFTSDRIDLREGIFHFQAVDVYTKDTLLLRVNPIMYYRISDVRKAMYEVDDLQGAMTAAAQTQLKEVFGLMTFHEALECQDFLNDHLVSEFGQIFEKWGVEVLRMEMLSISPGEKEYQTIHAMKLQMIAERQRRGAFIKNEGKKTATNIAAEGAKKKALTEGVAEQEATRKVSEGRAQATVILAQAEKTSLDAISIATEREGTPLGQYWITRKYLAFFQQLSTGNGGALYLPFEPLSISSIVHTGISRAFGRHAEQTLSVKYTPLRSSANLLDPGAAMASPFGGASPASSAAAAAAASGRSAAKPAGESDFKGLD